MGSTLDSIVAVSISLAAVSTRQKGFGRALILGNSNRFTGGVLSKVYSSSAAMLADSFLVSDPEYKEAVAYFSQTPAPVDVMVGYAPTDVAQIETLTPTALDTTLYSVTINGIVCSFTSGSGATAAQIVTGLAAAIAAKVPALPVVTSGTTTLILTSSTAGVSFTIAAIANIAVAHSTPDTGVDTALAAIIAAGGKDWYGLILCARGQADIQVAAAWIEAQTYDYIFMACSQDAAVITNSTTDVASNLKAKTYNRTAYLWSDDQADGPDAAWLGEEFPKQPGSSNYAFKNLAGILGSVDSVLTDSAVAFLEAKNANYYKSIAGSNFTQRGMMASGQWIDVIVGRDWIKFTMQAAVFQVLLNTAKVGFDDAGIGLLANAVKSVLEQAVAFKIINPGYTLTVPPASSFSSTQKGTRLLPSIPWSAELTGAIDGLTINGSLVP